MDGSSGSLRRVPKSKMKPQHNRCVSQERTGNVTTLTTTEASKRLDEVLDDLAESHEVVQIAGQRHSAVLVLEDDWRAIQETMYLSSIPGMKESIVEGLRTPAEHCDRELDW
jgi:PHD/YefM family antitoxin component YafN of YafNO toxin-antitoxin module